ncbi:TorF family putative porin [Sphingomonas sp.]|uniref:TorF family putative porin n=1 Tax=Sphingomonas sp. TaxID=28214 RepID=UPI001B1E128C|nr:TorF family putative porin [Sphingomonas sp.]MBO9714118.1 hypothetical protein [Sphingomonas sp.]
MRFSMITLGGLMLAAATPAMAQDDAAPADTPEITVTGSASLTSDYRFRGISQTGKDPALQGTININDKSGFYAGFWASMIDGDDAPAVAGFGKAEVDLYAGFTKTLPGGVGIDVGLLYYLYPIDKAKGLATDFFEPYASVSYTIGPVTAKVGANYAWSQKAIFDTDSLYLRGDVTVAIPGTPVSILGHVGHTDGALGVLALTSDKYWDWSLGAEASYKFAKVGVQYVDTSIKGFGAGWDDAVGADPGILGYVTLSF